MSSAKIVVLSLKEIIRVALFVVCGIFICILIAFLLLPEKTTDTSYDTQLEQLEQVANSDYSLQDIKNGDYIAQINIDKGQSFVQVSVMDSSITNVQIVDQDETASSFYPLLETVCDDINKKLVSDNSIEIETDYYNQYTAAALNDAITTALLSANN